MKKIFNWMLATSLMLVPAVFTSCDSDDWDDEARLQLISFERQALNEEGYWIGSENYDGSDDAYGNTSYPNTYTEGMLTLNTTYTTSNFGTYWSGYVISARRSTEFKKLTPDQFNSVTGYPHSGEKFCVVNTFGETIDINAGTGAEVQSLYYTNSAYTLNSILKGDEYSGGPFEKGDYLTCTITGTREDGSTASVVLVLADYRDEDESKHFSVRTWQRVDLTSLGTVTSLSFSFDGSRKGDYGLNTPAYLCIDDVIIKKPGS